MRVGSMTCRAIDLIRAFVAVLLVPASFVAVASNRTLAPQRPLRASESIHFTGAVRAKGIDRSSRDSRGARSAPINDDGEFTAEPREEPSEAGEVHSPPFPVDAYPHWGGSPHSIETARGGA